METFGRVTAVILAVLLLILFPLQYEAKAQANITNQRNFQEIALFIDRSCDLKEFTKEDYENFLETLQRGCDGFDFEIEIYTSVYTISSENLNLDEDSLAYEGVTYLDVVYTGEFIEILEREGSYSLQRGDMVTISVDMKEPSIFTNLQNLFFPFVSGETSFVYGGVVL